MMATHLPPIRRTTARRTVTAALAIVLGAAGSVVPLACAPAVRLRASAGAPATTAAAPIAGGLTQHVIVVSIDGLRPDAIARFRATMLQRLMRDGMATLDARTILPSKTLPSHTSMLTGVPPDRHGITWNDDEVVGRGLVPVPTAFAVARAHGLRTAAFFSKAKFRHLMVPGSLDYAQAPTGWWGKWSARRTVFDVTRYLEGGARPNLLFVHLGEPDYAGHAVGWMSWFYGRGVRTADEALGRVIDAADEAYGRGRYTLVVTADHGGHARDHGSADARDATIPWIVWGQGIRAGGTLPSGIRTMDTAATILWMLGVPRPADWVGRPVALPGTGAQAGAR